MSWTIAAMCTSIHPRTDDLVTSEPEPPDHDGNRAVENAVMLGFFVVLAAAGIWLLGSMADLRKTQDCAAQGRRNCGTIENPPRSQ